MSFGLLVRNSDGELVIDSNFLNYALVAEFSSVISITTTFGGPVLSFPGVITTPEPPLVAAKWPVNDNAFCWGIRPVGSPGNWTGFQIYFQAVPSWGNITVEFSIFAANPSSLSGFGLVVKNPQGRTTFDSSFAPLEISTFILPSGWTTLSTSLPVPGYRVTFYSRVNPSPTSAMILSCHRFGDLVYPGGVEGTTPVALAGYGYGYGTGNTIRLCMTLDTATPSVNPSALSTPLVYISPMTDVGFI